MNYETRIINVESELSELIENFSLCSNVGHEEELPQALNQVQYRRCKKAEALRKIESRILSPIPVSPLDKLYVYTSRRLSEIMGLKDRLLSYVGLGNCHYVESKVKAFKEELIYPYLKMHFPVDQIPEGADFFYEQIMEVFEIIYIAKAFDTNFPPIVQVITDGLKRLLILGYIPVELSRLDIDKDDEIVEIEYF